MLKFNYCVIICVAVVVHVQNVEGFPWLNIFKSEIKDSNADNVTLSELLRIEGDDILYRSFDRLGMLDLLSNKGITLVGPTDEAFRKMPRIFKSLIYRNKTFYEELLKYHIINDTVYTSELSDNMMLDTFNGQQIWINLYKDGKVMTVSGAPILKGDVNASNGVLQEVGKVMIPPFGDIMDTLKLVKTFSLLVQAIETTNFTSDMNGDGNYTLFAPTNRAFSRMGPLPSNKTELSEILQYHLASDVLYSAGFIDGQIVNTENGNNLTVSIRSRRRRKFDEEIYINNARILLPDVTCTNGVIHVIDEVLLPPKDQSKPIFKVVNSYLKFKSFMQIFGL